jgi:urease accessory protein
MKKISLGVAVAALVAAVPAVAFAHPGHAGDGLVAGFMHPFSGADHLLTMIAVGFWAAMLGGWARYAVPAAFVSVMMVGAAFGIAGTPIPLVESAVAASVVALGLLVAFEVKVPVVVASVIVAIAAFFHGFAHGAELPVSSHALAYIGGFVAATAILHGAGLTLGSLRLSSAAGRVAGRIVGAGMALVGLTFLAA